MIKIVSRYPGFSRLSETGSGFGGTGRKTSRQISFYKDITGQIRDIYANGEIPLKSGPGKRPIPPHR